MAGNRLSGVTTVGPRRARVVTPNDNTDLTDADGNKISGHIRADDAGTLVCVPEGNTNSEALITLTMSAGEVTQFVVRRVRETGTDISVLHVLF